MKTWKELALVNFEEKLKNNVFSDEQFYKNFIFDNCDTPLQLKKILSKTIKKRLNKNNDTVYNLQEMATIFENTYKEMCDASNIEFTPFIWHPFARWGKALKDSALLILKYNDGCNSDFFYEIYKDLVKNGFLYFKSINRNKNFSYNPQMIFNNINAIIQFKKNNKSSNFTNFKVENIYE